ncbi:MAG: TolC family protein, partial [Abitibacteriaceae bacterium]|nr:TolC family protein [Abditibacteriaceae bacterium]
MADHRIKLYHLFDKKSRLNPSAFGLRLCAGQHQRRKKDQPLALDTLTGMTALLCYCANTQAIALTAPKASGSNTAGSTVSNAPLGSAFKNPASNPSAPKTMPPASVNPPVPPVIGTLGSPVAPQSAVAPQSVPETLGQAASAAATQNAITPGSSGANLVGTTSGPATVAGTTPPGTTMPVATMPVAPVGPAMDDPVNPARPLAVEDAVRIGLARSPAIAAAVAGVASANANYSSLAARPGINLNLTRVQGTTSSPTLNGQNTDTFIDLGTTIYTSGQRRFQAAGAKAQASSTAYQLAETKLTLAQQIRDAYWALAAARAQTQLALVNLQDAQRISKLTQTQFEVGANPQSDVLRSSVTVAGSEQSYVTQQATESTALTAFNTLLNRPPLAPVQLAADLLQVNAVTGLRPTLAANQLNLAALTQAAVNRRPLAQAAAAQAQAAEFAVKQARASRRPDLSVDYERSVQQPVSTVLVGVHVPIFDFGNIRDAIKAAEFTRTQAVAQEAQARQQVTQQVAQAYTDYVQAQQLVTSYETKILGPSLTLLNMAQTGYREGAVNILAVLDAENNLRSARNSYINALQGVYKAADELQAATGDENVPVTVTQPIAGLIDTTPHALTTPTSTRLQTQSNVAGQTLPAGQEPAQERVTKNQAWLAALQPLPEL